MRLLKSSTCYFLLLLIILFPLNASAQLFGSDDEKWEKVFVGLKKINSRLVTLETSELATVKSQLVDLLRQIEEIKQTLPQLQGAVELNKSETLAKINKVDSKIADLEAEVKNQVLLKINQQNKILDSFKDDQKNFKDGLAQDIEQFERVNKENFQGFASVNKSALEKVVQRLAALDETTKKSFEDIKGLFISDVIPAMAKENKDNRTVIIEHLSKLNETNEKALVGLTNKNQKLIEIFGENIIQGADTRKKVDVIDKNILTVDKNLAAINKNITVNNKNLMMADEKINKLAETMKALQIQHSASSETLRGLKDNMVKAQEFDQLADEKINKLIENSSQLTVQANQLEESVIKELTESSKKENSNQDKIDLANEKLSRLIEILKAIAAEQDKLGQVVKVQSELNKAQAGLVKNQESIKEALADLRRKANVSISRGDDIKKTLQNMNKK
ncbi:MAG: hypothetical protein H8E32_10360 [Nitrospinae bacterium]|nr:hypothetical protein [Nitrospinota bacterium]